MSESDHYLTLLPTLVGLGSGMGLLTASVVGAAVRAVPTGRVGSASGVNNAARQAAGALGIPLYGAIAGSTDHPAQFVHQLHTLGLAATALWLAALALTWSTIPAAGR